MPNFIVELWSVVWPHWVIAAAAAVATAAFLILLRRILLARLPRPGKDPGLSPLELAAAGLRVSDFPLVFSMALWTGSQAVELPPRWRLIVHAATAGGLLLQGVLCTQALLHHVIAVLRRRKAADEPGAVTAMGAVGFLAQVAIWSMGLLLILRNLGVDITALLTGLGIAGIAVALAVQNILADVFASASILLDRPFVIGDFIAVGDAVGTVETIGLKTTRLRTPSGEQLVFGNADLLRTRIRNFGRSPARRVEFFVGVPYQVPAAKAARIPDLLREIVESQEGTRLERAALKEFAEAGINFEVIYFLESSDFDLYVRTQQAILLAILERFEGEEIPLGSPSRHLFLPSGVAPVRWP